MVAWQASRRQASRPGTGAAQAGVAQAAARWALKLMWRTWVGVVSLMRVPNEVASSASRNIFWPCRFLALSIYARPLKTGCRVSGRAAVYHPKKSAVCNMLKSGVIKKGFVPALIP